jgi:hypothetical protein
MFTFSSQRMVSSCGGFEPPTEWLTATYFTIKLAENGQKGIRTPGVKHNSFQGYHNKPLCHLPFKTMVNEENRTLIRIATI